MRRLSPAAWLGISALAVLAASLAGPRIVPLYDGVGFPDQPYEYVGQPSAPQAVHQDFSAADVAGPGITLQSSESGPQVKVMFAKDAITLPAGASHMHLSATPEAPTVQPPSSSIASNVYNLTATTESGSPTVKAGFAGVYLRLPQNVSFTSPPIMVYRSPGGQWKQLTTQQPGADIYATFFSGWGEYALALNTPPPSGQQPSAQPAHHKPPLLLPALIIGLLAVIIAVIRIANTRRHDPTQKS